ncbi:hypothetical protein N657DRAFT_650884 [Parathielavia appendiculata]|uniref:Uncharacterized protein n=1 Tax=Parathielavia appendiculata TaxID=2587402 RepID=A0AAN6TQG0_9PEZI|nr:hypothetical protein N657DRAFT_650884 [Parathielavia appendiculata]
MPRLSEISYSHAATVGAISAYFNFLAVMYLDEADILRPPEGGWPEMTPGRLQSFGKTDKVNMLLRQIPYLRHDTYGVKSEAEVGSRDVRFWNWMEVFRNLDRRPWLDDKEELEECKIMTEPLDEHGEPGLAPPHAVGLICTPSARDESRWILDTELGVIYWLACPDSIRYEPTREPILYDAFDYYAPEGEAEWRSEPAWAVVNFFELLKDQFRLLCTWCRSALRFCSTWTRSQPRFKRLSQSIASIAGQTWPAIARTRA